jgi:flagellar hook-length control protein FliK
MDLKPESLGKLSLKVVTERGIVVANFVAENEQVKAAIETNMQILKDALEKQGLSIQGFNVSVGNNSLNNSSNNSNNQDTSKNNKGSMNQFGRMQPIGAGSLSMSANLSAEKKINRYIGMENNINLTA